MTDWYFLKINKLPFNSRRAQIRSDFHHEIKYILNPDTTGEIFNGVAVNISGTGLCLYVSNHLSEGQGITIKSIFRDSYKSGIVRWSEKIVENIYRVGLIFTK